MPNIPTGTLILLPTTNQVTAIRSLISTLPPYYEIDVTYFVMTAINSMSLTNGGVLELLISEFINSIQINAWNNGNALLDGVHENLIASALIDLYMQLNIMFTAHGLWDGAGISYWKFFRFSENDVLLKYTGNREDVLRPCPNEPSSGHGGLPGI